MQNPKRRIARYDLTTVHSDPAAKVDIIFVHGLNGDPERTWTSPKNDAFWPADLLPQALKGMPANILVYGYNADAFAAPFFVKNASNPNSSSIYNIAQILAFKVTTYRQERLANPIIWVCHSLGGIIVKESLLYSNQLQNHQQEPLRSLYVSTYGIVFLGTPHQGSEVANWGSTLEMMAEAAIPRPMLYTEGVLLKSLKKDSNELQSISNRFLEIFQRFKILMVREAHKTSLGGKFIFVVDSGSAGPNLPGMTYDSIEATHSGMCKFSGIDTPGYREISTTIANWVREAPQTVHVRWKVEKEERERRAELEAKERVWPYHSAGQPNQRHRKSLRDDDVETGEQLPSQTDSDPSSASSQHPLIYPDGQRPNSFFNGRGEELHRLHKLLTDHHRRTNGTSAVLIQGMPGVGKTHLARQYMFTHQEKYPGGCFWIRAKSLQEAETAFLLIAKSAGLRDRRSFDKLQRKLQPGTQVEMVKIWLNEHEDWLVVFDGIHFEDYGMKELVPFAKNTAMIFTSTEHGFIGDYNFNNPQIIELSPLRVPEAQDLLLQELGKKKPYHRDDLQQAAELVRLMDGLPQMVHVAAREMTATRQPLSSYLRSYQSRPRVGALPAYKSVREQLQVRGKFEALNLMNLLCFFGQHVPVEMLTLGLIVFGRPASIPVKSHGPLQRTASLNNTFQTLIAFGLIERDETDAIDQVKLHSIAQAFFIDTLAGEKGIPFWLHNAAAMFVHSYRQADERIKNDPRTGLPDDYLRYQAHAKQLREHIVKFEKKDNSLLSRVLMDVDNLLLNIRRDINFVSQQPAPSTGEVPVSVFRSLSVSDSEESSGTPGPFSRNDWLDQPATDSPTDIQPHGLPYPPGPSIIPDTTSDDGTITPALQDRPLSFPSVTEEDEWIKVHHRTLKKTNQHHWSREQGRQSEPVSQSFSPSLQQTQWRNTSAGNPSGSITSNSNRPVSAIIPDRGRSYSPSIRRQPGHDSLRNSSIETGQGASIASAAAAESGFSFTRTTNIQSTRSSPAQQTSGFHPPGLVVEAYNTSALLSGPTLNRKTTMSNDTLGPMSSQESLQYQINRMTQSEPHILEHEPHLDVRPPASSSPWTGSGTPNPSWGVGWGSQTSAGGALSSQPMSRDASHESHHSVASDPGRGRGRGRSRGPRGSSRPPPRMSERASSVVESEPSPQLAPINKSQENIAHYRTASDTVPRRPSPFALGGNPAGSRNGGARAASSGSGSGGKPASTSKLQSGVPMPASAPNAAGNRPSFMVPSPGTGSPIPGHIRSLSRGSSTAVADLAGGETMSRGSSGAGFRVDGKMIAFGDAEPVDVAAADERVRKAHERSRNKNVNGRVVPDGGIAGGAGVAMPSMPSFGSTNSDVTVEAEAEVEAEEEGTGLGIH